MKRFLILLIFLLLIPFTALGQDNEYNNYINEYDLSAFDTLDSDTKEFLNALGIDEFSYESITDISVKTVISHITDMIRLKSAQPIKSGLVIVAFVILSSFFSSMSSELDGELNSTCSTVSALMLSIFLASALTDCIYLSGSTINLCANFAYAFFPTFCIITATSGSAMTSFSVNTMLLILAQGLNYIANLIFVPATNCFLALGICSGLRNELNLNGIISLFKKLIISTISTLSAVFVSILSIKTSVASKADALGLRSMRFAINSVVPVIGGSISEGLLSIQSYSSLIKTSVGVVGIIAVASIFLPALIEVNLWRLILSLTSAFGEVFGESSAVSSIVAFKDALLIIDVLLILTMVTTIISIGILVAAKTVI